LANQFKYVVQPVALCKLGVLGLSVFCIAGFQTVRLSGGPGPHAGRVEVLYNDTWGSVCDDYWRKYDADIVCRQLGYNESLFSYPDDTRSTEIEKVRECSLGCACMSPLPRRCAVCIKGGQSYHMPRNMHFL
jgi:hypothetical protein